MKGYGTTLKSAHYTKNQGESSIDKGVKFIFYVDLFFAELLAVGV
jgi:hypothetical protein